MPAVIREAVTLGLLAAAVAVDQAWLPRIPLGLAPDPLLLVVLGVALRRGLEAGALAGAAGGYLKDLAGGSPLGLFMLAYLAVGAAAGAASAAVDPGQRHAPAAAALLGSGLLVLVTGVVVAASGMAGVRWDGLLREAAIGAPLNALLAGAMVEVVARADRLTQRRYEGRVIGRRVPR